MDGTTPVRKFKPLPRAFTDAKDIDQAHKSLKEFEKLKRIRELEQKVAELESELKTLEEKEGSLEKVEKDAVERAKRLGC